jgi:hypothetical protein
VSARIGWVTTNSARVYVETDEPTTVEVDFRENPGFPIRTVTSTMLSRVHALLLTDLRPSTEMTQAPTMNESVTYDIVEVRATDAASPSNTTVHDPNLVFESEAFDVPSVEGPGPGIEQTVREHLMTDPPSVSVGAPNGFGRRVVTVDLTAFYKHGGSVTPAENRVFVVRAFRIRDGGDPLPLVFGDGLFNTAGGSGTTFAQEVDLDAEVVASETRRLDIPGTKILNSTPTGTNGAATLRFRVEQPEVQANDLLVITVEALVEVRQLQGWTQAPVHSVDCGSGSCTTVILSTARLSAFSQWDFPRTTEANFQGSDVVD